MSKEGRKIGIERNYGSTVGKETYEWGLQLHQYIPQADQGIVDEVDEFAQCRERAIRVLDLGCGPGRLTGRFASLPNVSVVGLDISPEFIQAARESMVAQNAEYAEANFLTYIPRAPFDVIVMQGVFHHVRGEERTAWIQKMHALLASGGVIIVGDEFIPAYEDGNEAERRTRAGLFYLHIIGEAVKGRAKKDAMDLAKEECINFVSDVLSEEDVCGYYDDETIAYIKREAVALNERLFSLDSGRRLDGAAAAQWVSRVIHAVRDRAQYLKDGGAKKRIDRGDYKISIEVLEKEFAPWFVPDKGRERQFGPVDSVGGMGVVVFQKL